MSEQYPEAPQYPPASHEYPTGTPAEPAPARENVTPIDAGPADYDLDARTAHRVRPYRLKYEGRMWTVEQPDIGTIMEAEQAPTAETFCELMFEDQWNELGPLLKRYADPSALWEIARAISVHFDLDTASRPRNRRERRAGPRRA